MINQDDPVRLSKTREVVETHFEIALDDEPPATRKPVYVDVVSKEHERRLIIPASLHGLTNIRPTVTLTVGRWGHIAAYHAVRAPFRYLPLAIFWSVIGAVRLIWRQLRWWWSPELSTLFQDAVSSKETRAGLIAGRDLRASRAFRGWVLLGQLGGIVTAVLLLRYAAPPWATGVVAAVVVPYLAHIGHPAGMPIVTPAIVAPRYRKLNSDIVLRAYYAAGLGHPEKPDMQVEFLSTMARDTNQQGSQVNVALPFGKTFDDAMNARGKIASGLDVSPAQVYLTRDKQSHRSHTLYVADVDPLAIPAGRTPLLDCKVRDIWTGAPLGLNERSRRIVLEMVFWSLLIGSQPRKGKTFTARSLALFAALDPFVRLSVFDGKGSPDWRKFALVAYTYGFGLLPDRVQGDPIENLRATLREIRKEILHRNVKLSELPTNVCPEGKLTREIARNPKYGMPVWVLVIDEFQEYLNTGDDEADLEIADNLVFIVKVGPSVGIIPISSTQRPSGIGSTGKVAKRFTDFRDNHLTRLALKTGSWQVSDLVLGAGAYSEGFDSSSLPVGDEYRGIGILYDGPVDSCTVRTHLADGQDAEKILLAARGHRERAGTLTGMAAGEDVAREFRDVLHDVRNVYHAGEAWISWEQLASRLAEQMPEHYADITAKAISAQVRAFNGIEAKKGRDGAASLWGVPRESVHEAIRRREIEAGR